jgi:hypothetical protein
LHPKSFAAKVNAYIDMILIHLYKPTANNRPELSSSAKWTPPLEGTVLVNLHGAMFSSKRQMVLGSLYEITLVHALLCVAEQSDDDAAIAELAEALAIGRALPLLMRRASRRSSSPQIFVGDTTNKLL